jgi:hypothetical protein
MIWFYPNFILKSVVKWLLTCLCVEMIKFISEFTYRQTYAIIIIEVILVWKIFTWLVVPHQPNLFKFPWLWVIHNICCDFNFDSEKKIHCISESIKFIWSANDWIWEHNFHTYHAGMLLTLCVKPCSTSSRYFTTLLS